MKIIYSNLVKELEEKLGRKLTKKEYKFVKWMIEKDSKEKNDKTIEGFVIKSWTCCRMNC